MARLERSSNSFCRSGSRTRNDQPDCRGEGYCRSRLARYGLRHEAISESRICSPLANEVEICGCLRADAATLTASRDACARSPLAGNLYPAGDRTPVTLKPWRQPAAGPTKRLGGVSCERGLALRTKPAPRTLRIIGPSFGPSILRRSRPKCTSTRFVSGTNL
jgi:hypothetical protein